MIYFISKNMIEINALKNLRVINEYQIQINWTSLFDFQRMIKVMLMREGHMTQRFDDESVKL